MQPHSALERELAAHAASLRALAADLVGGDAADDLVQETALRALASPPPQPHGLGGWLATILRRLAITHRRRDARRARRESAAAADEALPGADEMAARRDSLRAVTTALFTLPEPYQSTLLQRYFENLSPSAIASRHNLPLATVKSRLQRGIALLKEHLDRRQRGDWRGALALATGLAAPTAAVTLTAGVLAMAKTLPLSIAAALVLGAVVFWQFGGEAGSMPPSATASTHDDAPAPVAAGASLQTDAAADRSIAPTGAFPGVDLAHPFAFALRVRVIDPYGLPVAGASISLWPAGTTENVCPETTGEDGTLRIEWHARQATMRMAIRAAGELPRELDVRAGGETSVLLLSSGNTSVATARIEFSSSEIRVEADDSVPLQSLSLLAGRYRTHRQESTSPASPAEGMHPERLFVDSLLGATQEPSGGVAVLSELPIVSSFFGVKLARSYLATTELDHTPTTTRGSITGVVYGEDGKPVADAPVCLCKTTDLPIDRKQTDDEGRFTFENIDDGEFELRAGGGARGLARTTARPAVGGAPTALHLRTEETIRGKALGDESLENWLVDYEALDGSWVDRATVHADGTFVLANIPGRPGRVWLRRDAEALPVAIAPSVLPDSGELTFDLRHEQAASSRIAVRMPPRAEDQPANAATITCWQQDTRLGARLSSDGKDDDGALHLIGALPAGWYRLELSMLGSGTRDLGTHYLDGKQMLDLGTTSLGPTATLQIDHRTANVAIELCHRRPHGDVRALLDVPVGTDSVQLPPGKWLMFTRTDEQAPQVREFELRAGATTTIDLAAQSPSSR